MHSLSLFSRVLRSFTVTYRLIYISSHDCICLLQTVLVNANLEVFHKARRDRWQFFYSIWNNIMDLSPLYHSCNINILTTKTHVVSMWRLFEKLHVLRLSSRSNAHTLVAKIYYSFMVYQHFLCKFKSAWHSCSSSANPTPPNIQFSKNIWILSDYKRRYLEQINFNQHSVIKSKSLQKMFCAILCSLGEMGAYLDAHQFKKASR